MQSIRSIDYFRDTWNIRLYYTYLLVVELYDTDDKNQSYFVPMELVNVDEGQPNLQALTTELAVSDSWNDRPGICNTSCFASS